MFFYSSGYGHHFMIKLLRFPTDISTDNPLINIRFYINCLSMTTFISNEELTENTKNFEIE